MRRVPFSIYFKERGNDMSELYDKVKDILEINKKERHIRGGLATKRKYAEIACRRKTKPRLRLRPATSKSSAVWKIWMHIIALAKLQKYCLK